MSRAKGRDKTARPDYSLSPRLSSLISHLSFRRERNEEALSEIERLHEKDTRDRKRSLREKWEDELDELEREVDDRKEERKTRLARE